MSGALRPPGSGQKAGLATSARRPVCPPEVVRPGLSRLPIPADGPSIAPHSETLQAPIAPGPRGRARRGQKERAGICPPRCGPLGHCGDHDIRSLETDARASRRETLPRPRGVGSTVTASSRCCPTAADPGPIWRVRPRKQRSRPRCGQNHQECRYHRSCNTRSHTRRRSLHS